MTFVEGSAVNVLVLVAVAVADAVGADVTLGATVRVG